MPETQELAKLEPAPALSANRKLTSLTVDEMLLVAEGFHRSQAFKNGKEVMTKSELFVVIMMGQELGIGPGAAVSGIRMIEGRPELSANLQLGAMKASGKYDYRAVHGTMQLFNDDGEDVTANYPKPNYCTFTVFNVADGEEVGETTFTMYDADRAGLLQSSRSGHKSNYMRYPANMLFARAGSNASAFFTPDALMMRTYHTGEIEGRVDAAVPELVAEEAQDVEAEEIDLFDPETEEPPKAVEPPPTFAPELVPEFARTPEEQQAVEAKVDMWGDRLDATEEPLVETQEQERTCSPGQRGLMFVRAKAAGLSEEELSALSVQVTGQPHVDRVPMRLVDTMLREINAMKGAK